MKTFLKIYFIDIQLIQYSCVDFCCTAVIQFHIYRMICMYIFYICIYEYIHAYIFFFILYAIMVCYRLWNTIPCAMQQDLVIHSLYNSLHLLTSDSQSTPPPPFFPLATTGLFSLWVCFCFVDKFICIIFQIPHVSDRCLSFSF